MKEQLLTNQLIEALNYTGQLFCWRVNSGALQDQKGHWIRLAKAGTSDIQGIRKRDGRMVCIEVKLPTTRKSVTDKQWEYLQKMREYGALTGVACSVEDAYQISGIDTLLTGG